MAQADAQVNALPISRGEGTIAALSQDRKGNLRTQRAYTSIVAMTVGTIYAAGTGFFASCSSAGNITLVFQDGTSGTFNLPVGLTQLPFSVTSVSSSSATASFFSLS